MASIPDSPTGLPTGINWSQVLPLILSGYQAIHGTAGRDATTAANRADPWGPQRGQYQDQLNAFMKDPSTIFKDPAFVAARDQGLEGVGRIMGASGMGTSGNALAGLYKYGDTFAYDAENNKYKQLAELAGVNAGSPGIAGNILMQGDTNRNANLGTGLAGVGSLLNGLLSAGVPQGIISAIRNALGGGGGGPAGGYINQGGLGISNNPGGPLGDDNIDVGGGWNPGGTTPTDPWFTEPGFSGSVPDVPDFDYGSIFGEG